MCQTDLEIAKMHAVYKLRDYICSQVRNDGDSAHVLVVNMGKSGEIK